MAAPGLFLQHPRRGRVSFHDTRMEVRVVSLACLSDELRKDIWYTPSDIEGMRTEARDLCRYLRVNPQACPEEHTRGLELRISLERQCRKQLTVQGVVEAQRRCPDPAFLASLAERCSMVPKEMAIAQAQKDYCTVYVNATGPLQLEVPPAAAMANFQSSSTTTSVHPRGNMPLHNNMARNNNNNNNNMGNHLFAAQLQLQAGPPPAMAAHAAAASISYPQQQQQLPQQEDLDGCLEPIPLSAPDQSMMVLQGNKRMLNLFQDNQERSVRRRLQGEGYPATRPS